MAYFFWEDDGVLQMLDEFEPDFVGQFRLLPSNVERADVFRILVLKWFGGIVRITHPPRTRVLFKLTGLR
jgi:mannosyltransferase OCH1-like enzyme